MAMFQNYRARLLRVFAGALACAWCGTARGEIKILKAGSVFKPAEEDVGAVRDFVQKGGILVCTDALYPSIWNFLGELKPGFGDVKWKLCDSWKKDGGSQTTPVGKIPHPIVSFPNAYDDADTWGHFIGGTCKGWTVLATCGDDEPMLLYRSLGQGGVLVAANLWWFGEVPKLLKENLAAWAALAEAGLKVKTVEMTPLRNGKGRIRIALATALQSKAKLELTALPEGKRKVMFSKKFTADGVTLDYDFNFLGKVELELAVVADERKNERRTTILSRTLDFSPPLTLAPADGRGWLSTKRRTDGLYLAAEVNPAKAKAENALIRLAIAPVSGGKVIAKEAIRLPAKDASRRHVFKVKFPKEAPAGKYRIVADLKPGDGAPAGKAETTIEVVEPKAGQFLVDADGVILRGGQPFFPLGIYHVDPPDYAKVKSLGFNFVQSFKYKMVLEKGIPAAEKADLPVLVEGYYKDIPAHILDAWLKTPTTAMWYVADEPNERHAERVREAYEAYHEWDKTSLTYITSNRPDLFGWLSNYADVFSCDCYGDMRKCVDWLRRANRAIRPGQAFVFIPAAITKDERVLRAQAFLGIAHGATGLIWYCWEDEDYPQEELAGRDEQKSAFKTLLAELNANAAYLTSPDRFAFESGAVHGIVLGDPAEPRRALVVNVLSDKPAKAAVNLPDGAVLKVDLAPLEARVVELAPKTKRRGR